MLARPLNEVMLPPNEVAKRHPGERCGQGGAQPNNCTFKQIAGGAPELGKRYTQGASLSYAGVA